MPHGGDQICSSFFFFPPNYLNSDEWFPRRFLKFFMDQISFSYFCRGLHSDHFCLAVFHSDHWFRASNFFQDWWAEVPHGAKNGGPFLKRWVQAYQTKHS